MEKTKFCKIWAVVLIAILFAAATVTGMVGNVKPTLSDMSEKQTIEQDNDPPTTPETPIGPTQLYSGDVASYYTTSYIDGGGTILYHWNWGDSSEIEISYPTPSGEPCYMTHSWTVESHGYGWTWGLFYVKVKAENIVSNQFSEWSEPLLVAVGILLPPPPEYQAESIAVLSQVAVTYMTEQVTSFDFTSVVIIDEW